MSISGHILYLEISKIFRNCPPYIENDCENIINVKMPNKYADLTECRKIEGHILYTLNDIINYFQSIKDDNIRITMINGIFICPDAFGLYCDYCKTFMRDREDDVYYHCQDCCLDMCNLCYDETSEEIAIKNGAKNWHERKDKLNKCRDLHTLSKRFQCSQYYCDICDKIISDNERYSNISKDNRNCNDVCLNCSSTDEGKDLIEKKSLTLRENHSNPMEYADFGSLLDWVPIMRDNEYNHIFINLNPDSQYFEKICLLSGDDHGRCGYFVIKEKKLDKLLDDLEDYYKDFKKKWENEESPSWDEYYDYPIKRYMESHNFQIHYG